MVRKVFPHQLDSKILGVALQRLNLTIPKLNYIKSQITNRKFQEYLIFNEIRQSHATEEVVHFSELSDAVEEAMKKLPEKTCEVFRMSRFENQSVKEIAVQLN